MKTKRFLYLGLLIAVLLVTACGSKATPEPTATPTPLPPSATPAPTATQAQPVAGGHEIPMGFTAEGLPYRGNPNAPVTLWEYSDFQ